MYRPFPIKALALFQEREMWLRAIVLAFAVCTSAQAQISPTGPPHNAPPAETMQPTPAQTEAEASEKFAKGGYPNVRDVRRSSDGGWTGTAVVNERSFTVHLNREGEVERRD